MKMMHTRIILQKKLLTDVVKHGILQASEIRVVPSFSLVVCNLLEIRK